MIEPDDFPNSIFHFQVEDEPVNELTVAVGLAEYHALLAASERVSALEAEVKDLQLQFRRI
jgi:hypothetical protein